MPSACTKPENKASTEATSSISQCIQIVEKKVRNLEKRKGKLDAYIDKRNEGNVLNQDQEEAISKYDSVLQNLEFARELQKQFQGISNEIEKMMKKKAKRDKAERQEQEISRIQEVLKLQELLSNMGSDDVREDFKKGLHGAIVLTDNSLEQLDELYKLITPSREGETSYAKQLTQSSEHIVNFLESREKDVTGTTYKQLKELVNKINDCGYFENLANREEEKTPEPEAPSEEQTSVPEPEIPEPEESEEFQPPTRTIPEPEQMTQVIEPVVPVVQQLEQHQQQHQQQHLQQQQQQQTHNMQHPVTVAPSLVRDQEPVVAYEDDSFFTTAPQYTAPQQPRGFQEIVSSVQGNFNFLQDSEIDLDSPQRVDPAVVAAARPMSSNIRTSDALHQASYQGVSLLSSDDQSVSAAATYTQQVAAHNNQDVVSHHAAAQPVVQHVTSDSLDFGAASTPSIGESVQQSNTSSQLQFGAVDPMSLDSQSSSLAASSSQQAAPLEAYEQTYSQNLMSQSLGGSTSSQHVSSFSDQSASSLMSSHMSNLQDQSGSASSSSGPPQPIPLPSQAIPGQPLINQGFGATDSENSASQQQEKKPYTMNPNADPFQSSAMFTQSSMPSVSGETSSSLPQSTPSTGSLGQETQRKPAWQTPTTQSQEQSTQQQSQQQDSSEYNNSGFGNSNQYGRNAGGPPRGGRGGSRGGGNRGMNNGFPRGGNRGGPSYGGNRNGGYNNNRGGSRGGSAWQGYSARNDYRPEGGYQGYNNGFNSGGMRGGPPRGGGMRGRGGGSGGFSRPGNQPYSQQA